MYNTGVGLWHFFQLGSPLNGLIDIYIQRHSKAKYPKLQVHQSFNKNHSYHHVREVWCVSEFLLFDWQTQWYTHIDHTQGALARPVARKQMTKSQSWRILCPPTPLLWHVCSLFAAHSRSQRDVLVSLDQPLIQSLTKLCPHPNCGLCHPKSVVTTWVARGCCHVARLTCPSWWCFVTDTGSAAELVVVRRQRGGALYNLRGRHHRCKALVRVV